MLDDVAAYLTLAPLLATVAMALVLGVLLRHPGGSSRAPFKLKVPVPKERPAKRPEAAG